MERGDTGDTYSQHTLAWVSLTGTQDLDHPAPGASSEDCVDTLSWVSWGSHGAMDNFPLITGPMGQSPASMAAAGPRPDMGQIWAGVESGRGQDTHIWSPAAAAARHLP